MAQNSNGQGDVVLRFNEVSFNFGHNKPILKEADFSLRKGAKFTLMGQNGAGKTTLFKLINGEIKPEEGEIIRAPNMTIASGKQVIPRDQLPLTVKEFFEQAFPNQKIYDLDRRIEKILEVVHLHAPLDRKIKDFSGGQQARLLLSFALIQNPDLLLLDEPTNNLDKAGIAHLTEFLIEYPKTCLVISHDANFLNSFTHGVLYLDSFTKKIDLYAGNYLKVVEEITRRIEAERRLAVRQEKEIEHRKEQANFFAQKGGHMRDVARKMREKIEDIEADKIEERQEDKTIRSFAIPCQDNLSGEIVTLTSVSIMEHHKPTAKKVKIVLKKRDKLLISGPNGIGKSTLLEHLASGKTKGMDIAENIRIGFYRQDFSTLDFDQTVYESLASVLEHRADISESDLRSTAAGFLITAELMNIKVGHLSEGQKGLLSFARLVLQKPGLLILDEPTNHINFRHLPVISKALQMYEGAMILVSHMPEFIKEIKTTHDLDLGSL
jgi:ATPase subunit of ABC transporter with duplicated ATPase domains